MSEKPPAGPEPPKRSMIVVTQDGCVPCPDCKKMVEEEAAPRGVAVKEIKLGEDPNVDSILTNVIGVQRTPAVLFVEDAHLKRVFTPEGIPDDDKRSIRDTWKESDLHAKEPAGSCQVTFRVDDEGWHLDSQGGEACNDAIQAAGSLNRSTRKNLAYHIETEDPTMKVLLAKLTEGR